MNTYNNNAAPAIEQCIDLTTLSNTADRDPRRDNSLLPSQYDPTREDPRWIPREDTYPPSWLPYKTHNEAKDAF
ncbi:hypothetical protein P3342_007433 [Pyrenophora teres f. teres]|nr:hypothetical protein P3342_007433 [Pyrenophora teres f. teres]